MCYSAFRIETISDDIEELRVVALEVPKHAVGNQVGQLNQP